jgi:hypothetical protein
MCGYTQRNAQKKEIEAEEGKKMKSRPAVPMTKLEVEVTISGFAAA